MTECIFYYDNNNSVLLKWFPKNFGHCASWFIILGNLIILSQYIKFCIKFSYLQRIKKKIKFKTFTFTFRTNRYNIIV